MRISIFCFLFLFFHLFAFGQDEAPKVSFVAYWAKGDTYRYRVIKQKKEYRDGVVSKNDSSQYVVTFEVIDSTEKSYTIRWKSETPVLGDVGLPSIFVDQVKNFQSTEVIYTTTELGEFVGIENWEELSKKMTSMMTELFNLMPDGDKVSKEELMKSLQPLMVMFSTKEGLESYTFKELKYFHFPFGFEFETNKPLVYEELLPNVFGGKPIKGDAVLKFEHVDTENSFCILKQEMKLNEKDTKRVINEVFEKMNLPGKEMKEFVKKAKMNVTDNNTYEYFYFPGVPARIETIRTTEMNLNGEDGKRIDSTIIEIITDEE